VAAGLERQAGDLAVCLRDGEVEHEVRSRLIECGGEIGRYLGVDAMLRHLSARRVGPALDDDPRDFDLLRDQRREPGIRDATGSDND
jgi:hypothetical protein